MTTKGRILVIVSAIAVLIMICLNGGIAATAETNPLDFGMFVHIPEGWTNTYEDWIDPLDDVVVYFKVSDSELSESDWGTYTDFDAQVWDSGVVLDDTDIDGDYIKFWFVKDNVASEEDVPEENISGEGYLEEGFQEEGNPDEFIWEEGYLEEGNPGDGFQVEAIEGEGYLGEDFPVEGIQGEYWLGEGYSSEGIMEEVVLGSTASEDAVLSETEPFQFFLDRTAPEPLENLKKNEETNPYMIEGSAKDVSSGIRDVFYSVELRNNGVDEAQNGGDAESQNYDPANPQNDDAFEPQGVNAVGPQYIDAAEVELNCNRVENVNANDGGVSFSIECTSDMPGKRIYVYVIDNAENVYVDYIDVDSYMDTSAPSLTVEGIDKDTWVNADSIMEWNVSTDSEGATIYYKTSDKNEEDWGSYEDASEWNDDALIPEGEGYIHFWALYDDPRREIAESETKQYKYDPTPPEQFQVVVDHIIGHYDDFEQEYVSPQFVIRGSNIRDLLSGVDVNSFEYEISQDKKTWVEKVPVESIIENTDGSFRFALDLSDVDWIDNVKFKFYVSDMVGNRVEGFTSSPMGIEDSDSFSYDPHAPEIIKDEDSLGITKGTDDTLSVMKPFSFGSEKAKTMWNSVYVNDKDHYLKVTVNDNNLSKIIIYVDNSQSGIEFSEVGSETQGRKWVRNEENDVDSKAYYIKVSDLNLEPDTNHSITIKASDGCNTSAPAGLSAYNGEEEKEYTLFYDPEKEGDLRIAFEPSEESKGGYYGVDYGKITIGVFVEDDNALSGYDVKINGNTVFESPDLSKGEEVSEAIDNKDDSSEVEGMETDTYWMPLTASNNILPLDNEAITSKDGKPDGKYDLVVSVRDLAGNEYEKTFSFIIDTTPPVIDRCEYQYDNFPLNFQPFGIFGNESYKIRIKGIDPEVEESVSGIGIQGVTLSWDSVSYAGNYNSDIDMYEFEGLPIGHRGVLELVIRDALDNSAAYCMTVLEEEEGVYEQDVREDQEPSSDKTKKGNIPLVLGKGSIPLVIENVRPVSSIIPPKEFAVPADETDTLAIYKQTFEDDHVEWWYPNDVQYQITAQDVDSGLKSVFVFENDNQRDEKKEFGEISFTSGSFVKLASYTYGISAEGDYKLFTYAVDNAWNSNEIVSQPDQSLIIHLDETKPQITEFRFGGISEQGSTVEPTTYGTFFMDDVEVRVYVDDPGVSSGLNNVVLYLDDISGDSKTFSKNVSEFDIDQENGQAYASFVIEKGFKGKVAAIVTDNVGHSSGIINTDGCIVENPDLHMQTSSIDIKENDTVSQYDANGLPLFNTSIPVTVTTVDSFSGISRIDWSIANDNKTGTIEVDINGDWRNVAGDAQVLEDSIERDQNLITKIQFVIVVDSNTNGNVVHAAFTDRAGNSSEYDTAYSIDTTVPVISASMEGGEVVNEYYYNTDQTVTVSITERNFDPGAVEVKVNNADWSVKWEESGASVTTDETVHIGTFSISSDGEYDFTVNYTDMAGNMGTSYTQSRFILDKTSPKIANNFESFGSIGDENIYYNRSQQGSVIAEIIVIETNFSPFDMNVEVYYKPSGSNHSDNDVNWDKYYYTSDWKDSGEDVHKLNIPFAEEGVYKIEMSPKDRAENAGDFSKGDDSQYPSRTAIFETDYTEPIVVARNEKSVKSNDLEFYDLYDFDRRNEDAPTVTFEDINIDHISCEGQKYTPSYTGGREIGGIKPKDMRSKSSQLVEGAYVPQMVYILPDFTKDGVYSVKLTAYDKAGNESKLNNNTYVRMVDPTVNVLAYIENSNREKSEGWYSFEDDNGPISKRPGSFSDLSIVVFSKTAGTRINLVDKATGRSTDTNITDKGDALFDDGMYQVGAYRYILPGAYFEENYTADADTNLYLQVENNGDTLELGEMYIDNTNPNCNTPMHFHNWGWLMGSGKQMIRFDNVSEELDTDATVAYIDRRMIHLTIEDEEELSEFRYDKQNNALTLTLEPGSHNVGLLLVDRAGNKKFISEVRHLAVGYHRIWFGAGAGVGAILLAVVAVFAVKKVERIRSAKQ